MRRVMCWECGRRAPMEEALARVRAGEDDPHCRVCGGILKSDTISFGQSLVPEVIDRALTRRRRGRPAARDRHDAAGAAGGEHGADRGARRRAGRHRQRPADGDGRARRRRRARADRRRC